MADGSCRDDIPEDAVVISANDVGGGFSDGEAPTESSGSQDSLLAEACCIPAVDPYGRAWFLGACWLPFPAEPMLWGCGCVGPTVYYDLYFNNWFQTYPPSATYYNGYTCIVE